MVVKTDSPPRARSNGEDRSGETTAESGFKDLRPRQDYDPECPGPDGRKIWTLERVLGILFENGGYEVLANSASTLREVAPLLGRV